MRENSSSSSFCGRRRRTRSAPPRTAPPARCPPARTRLRATRDPMVEVRTSGVHHSLAMRSAAVPTRACGAPLRHTHTQTGALLV
eukprot:605932-Prymnesium_polylepis.1